MRIRPTLSEGWSTLILLWAMMLVASVAIMQTELIDGLHIIPVVSTLAMFAGLLLAKSHFKDNTAHIFSLVYGTFVVFYLVGTILPSGLSWQERALEVISRQAVWIEKAINGGTSRDGLIFVIQTSAVYWLLGYTAAWYTFRYPRVWRVVVPTGLVLLSVVYYYNGPNALVLFLAAYALLAMLYVSRTHVAAQEMSWRSAAVRYERGIWFDFLRAGFLATVLILFLSWSLPTLSASTSVSNAISGTQQPWREFQDNWTRLFSSLRAYGTATTDPYQESLALGGPRTVGNSLVMDVIVPRQLPYVYWQAIAYDQYEDGLWTISQGDDTRLHFPDDGPLGNPTTAARETVEQTFVNYLPNSSFLYAAPEVLRTDRQMFVESRQLDEGSELVSAIRSRFVLRQGDRYQVASRLSTADMESLRGAGSAYPGWVSERYLQLPESISPETINLAGQLTEPFDNAFDMSIAVRDYLRTNISYNDQIAAPPQDVDPVHYTLFESQEGYCNYYASAMVMMLRSQGVPARIVSGYAQGEWNEESSSYRVRANNAHTWVETYFPNFGWIQFEPTASIPLIERPATAGGGDAFASPGLSLQDQEDLESLSGLNEPLGPDADLQALLGEDGFGPVPFWERIPVWQVLAGFIILAIAGALILLANQMNRRVESDVEGSYHRLDFWAKLMGVFFKPVDTPYERAEHLSAAAPEGNGPIRNLTRQYVVKRFSSASDLNGEVDLVDEWRQLRPILIRKSISAKAAALRNGIKGRLSRNK